jgi:hypothetical protein
MGIPVCLEIFAVSRATAPSMRASEHAVTTAVKEPSIARDPGMDSTFTGHGIMGAIVTQDAQTVWRPPASRVRSMMNRSIVL